MIFFTGVTTIDANINTNRTSQIIADKTAKSDVCVLEVSSGSCRRRLDLADIRERISASGTKQIIEDKTAFDVRIADHSSKVCGRRLDIKEFPNKSSKRLKCVTVPTVSTMTTQISSHVKKSGGLLKFGGFPCKRTATTCSFL